MMTAARRESLQITIGAGVVAVLVAFLAIVFSRADLGDGRREFVARFLRADGLSVGTEVRAAGIRVGEVVALSLDADMRAVARLRVDPAVVLDVDAAAEIVSDGLFGAKFVRLEIGGADEMIGDGEEIAFTADSMILDDLLELIVNQGRALQRDDAADER